MMFWLGLLIGIILGVGAIVPFADKEIEYYKNWGKKYAILLKAVALHEFAHRLKEYIPNIEGETTMECVEQAINQTLKEMEGEEIEG